jgi:hypothetical protein
VTQDEQLDRLERSLRLFLKRPVRDRREASITATKLGAYVTALGQYDAARRALEQKPDNLATNETLSRARESLDQAREELKRLSKSRPRRFSV